MTKSKIKELLSNRPEYILYILRELVRAQADPLVDEEIYTTLPLEHYKIDEHGTYYFITISSVITEFKQLEILAYAVPYRPSDVTISYTLKEVKAALSKLTDDERLYLILTSNVLKSMYYKEDENEQSNI